MGALAYLLIGSVVGLVVGAMIVIVVIGVALKGARFF